MPIYEYRCLGCDSHVEKMQKLSDEPLKTCEKCAGELQKQVSLSGFQFKGAGWYVTDYTNKPKEKGAEKSEKSEKSEKTETPEKSGGAEKSSPVESTAKTETASKKTDDSTTNSKKDTVSKKD